MRRWFWACVVLTSPVAAVVLPVACWSEAERFFAFPEDPAPCFDTFEWSECPPMAPEEAELVPVAYGRLFWMTAAPDELSTLFVISLNALFTEKLRPYICCDVVLLPLGSILGSPTVIEDGIDPTPVD